MTKNEKISASLKETRKKRKRQLCRVYELKIDYSRMNKLSRTQLKMLFVEAKWLYNYWLSLQEKPWAQDYAED